MKAVAVKDHSGRFGELKKGEIVETDKHPLYQRALDEGFLKPAGPRQRKGTEEVEVR